MKAEKSKLTQSDLIQMKRLIPICIKEEDEERELLDFDDSVEIEFPDEYIIVFCQVR